MRWRSSRWRTSSPSSSPRSVGRDPDLTDLLRSLNAGNAGPFTLDGTRSWLVGRREVAIIDPGPDVDSHVRALASAVEGAERVSILLTHGHGDHAGAAPELARRLGASVYGPSTLDEVDEPLSDGDAFETDAGPLVTVATPGHTRDHLAFHWPDERALFVGDLFLGEGDTTWVAEYPGCVRDYLDSLARLRDMNVDVLYPAHGPALQDPVEAIDRFETHRRDRIEQVRSAMATHPSAGLDELVDAVYGDALPDGLRGAAARSLAALVEYVRDGEQD